MIYFLSLRSSDKMVNISFSKKTHTLKGFTLIEVLLVIAVITIIAGLTLPISQLYQNKNDLQVATQITVQSLRRAQILSQSQEYDDTWGVNIASGTISIFRGASYAGRTDGFDEDFTISTGITPSGVSEVVYAKLTGLPGTTGTITLTAGNGDASNVVVNAKGMISY
jgi:prepilin-type N-terminal cleavage/methylation domain-containing protein